jgi:AcrR family transcriptional regulator
MISTTDNKARVRATVSAYYEFVEDKNGAFRLVFESDLTGEPEVRDRLEAVERQCANAVAAVIAEDTGLPEPEAQLLGAGLAGIAQVTARTWAAGGEPLPKDQAIDLVASLAWRGIRGFPRTDEH